MIREIQYTNVSVKFQAHRCILAVEFNHAW